MNSIQQLIQDSSAYRESEVFQEYVQLFKNLPQIDCTYNFKTDVLHITNKDGISQEAASAIAEYINSFKAWRIGPYQLFDHYIEGNWKSNQKWNIINPHLGSLEKKTVADIGANNGYYLFKLVDAGAQDVVGFEPFVPFYYQFALFQHFVKIPNISYLSLGFEALKYFPEQFDTILLMGILYHHLNPVDILKSVYIALKPGGTLIIETAVNKQNENYPQAIFRGRDKNKTGSGSTELWIPNVKCVEAWVSMVDFSKIELIKIDDCFNLKKTDDASINLAKETNIYPEYLDRINPENPTLLNDGFPVEQRAYFKVTK